MTGHTGEPPYADVVAAVADLTVVAEDHDEQLAALAKSVRRKSPRITGRPRLRRTSARPAQRPPAPWSLRPVGDPVDSVELAGWIAWFALTYPVDQRYLDVANSATRADLAALYLSWQAAYQSPDASSDDPLHWHEALARCIDRLENWQRRREQLDDRALEALLNTD